MMAIYYFALNSVNSDEQYLKPTQMVYLSIYRNLWIYDCLKNRELNILVFLYLKLHKDYVWFSSEFIVSEIYHLSWGILPTEMKSSI